MLGEIKAGGEEKALQYARELDGFDGDVAGGVVVSEQEFAEAERSLNDRTRQDIRMAHDAIRAFATAQRDSVSDLCTEDYPWPGMVTGHRLIAVDVAGCYVPGGRFAHVASALMTVATARRWCTESCRLQPAQETCGPYSCRRSSPRSRHHVITLGGVQAVCALAYGLPSLSPSERHCWPREPFRRRGEEAAVCHGTGRRYYCRADGDVLSRR